MVRVTTPTEDQWPAVIEVLRQLYERGGRGSLREIAAEVGITHPTLIKIFSGETGLPYPATRRKIWAWVLTNLGNEPLELSTEARDLIATAAGTFEEATVRRTTSSLEDEALARTVIGDPNALRRVLGVIPAGNLKVRMAIIRQYEDVLIENAVPPPRWPAWFHEIREEILKAQEGDGGTDEA